MNTAIPLIRTLVKKEIEQLEQCLALISGDMDHPKVARVLLSLEREATLLNKWLEDNLCRPL